MDTVRALDDLEPMELCDCAGKTAAIARAVDAADSNRAELCAVEDELALIVAIHFRDGIGERCGFEENLAAAPGGDRVDAWGVDPGWSELGQSETLTWRKRENVGLRL